MEMGIYRPLEVRLDDDASDMRAFAIAEDEEIEWEEDPNVASKITAT